MKTILLLFLLLSVLYFALSLFLFRLMCLRFDRRRHNPLHILGQNTDQSLRSYTAEVEAGRRWMETTPRESVEIHSFDGLRLRGWLYENPEARAVLVASHGYQSTGERDFGPACEFYYRRGFTILLVDQRAAGRSEGKYVTLGLREHCDIEDWCRFAQARFPELPTLLAGISMGATIALMASPRLPENVRCLLADCGYADAWEEVRYVFRHARMPLGPVLKGIDFWCRCLGGFSLRQYSAPEALAHNTRPILFIHGQKDSFVPWTNSLVNLQACPAPTQSFFVPQAAHGLSFFADPEGYAAAVDSFLDAYLFTSSPHTPLPSNTEEEMV